MNFIQVSSETQTLSGSEARIGRQFWSLLPANFPNQVASQHGSQKQVLKIV